MRKIKVRSQATLFCIPLEANAPRTVLVITIVPWIDAQKCGCSAQRAKATMEKGFPEHALPSRSHPGIHPEKGQILTCFPQCPATGQEAPVRSGRCP